MKNIINKLSSFVDKHPVIIDVIFIILIIATVYIGLIIFNENKPITV